MLLVSDYQFLDCFVNFGNKVNRLGFGEGWSGYIKHN